MNQTQREISNAFWKLLEEKPYRRITVRDIVERCHLNRNTFYYHFQDIPALAEFSVKAWVDQALQKSWEAEAPAGAVIHMAREASRRRNALMHIYRFSRREDFIRYLYEISLYVVRSYAEYAPQKKLCPEDSNDFEKISQCILAGVALDWLDTGGGYDLAEFFLKIGVYFSVLSKFNGWKDAE